MKKMLLFAMALGLAFVSCSKEEVPLYDTDNANFIQFVDPSKDTAELSFMFYPTVKTDSAYNYAIPVKILGLAKDVDREYKVTVIDSMTTAEAGKHFEVPTTATFHAGLYEDTLFIKLYRTADLLEKKVRLGIRIEYSNDFFVGEPANSERHLIFSDMLARPAWWTPMLLENGRYDQNSVEYKFLGPYSDKKYLLLMEVTKVGDWTDLSEDERRVLALQLKRYLEKQKADGNTVYEDSYSGGVPEEMSVNVMG
jgi:hypothetical protein